MFGIDWQDVPADHMCQDCGREVYSPEGICLYCEVYAWADMDFSGWNLAQDVVS